MSTDQSGDNNNIQSNTLPIFSTAAKILKGRAFRMETKVGTVFRNLYGRTAQTPEENPDKPHYVTATNWLIAPFTKWPVDFEGVAHLVYGKARRGQPLDEELRFMLNLVKNLPSETAQQIIGDYEHIVQQGAYDQLVSEEAQQKYALRLKQLLDDPEFHADWARVKKLYDITRYQTKDTKQIIRRTLVMERNMRVDFMFRWLRERHRFARVFDCFCWKHSLYGMEGDKPLLMKVTVNPTSHGTQLFIPGWMSFDIYRDLNHGKLVELMRCEGVLRQGSRFSEARLENMEKARLVVAADADCKRLKYKGKKRIDYIIEKADLPPDTGDRRIRALRKLGEELLEGGAPLEIDEAARRAAMGNPGNTAKLAEAKALVASLNEEEKRELMKWMEASESVEK